MKKEEFEKLVEQALTELPPKFKKYLDNLAVIVESQPSGEIYERTSSPPLSSILGHYHGVPLKHRGPYYGNIPPDVIVIYQSPIEAICSTEEEIKKKVREVVYHEIGHYFGLSEKQMREIEE